MSQKIILISGEPGIQHWKVAAKTQALQVRTFSELLSPKLTKAEALSGFWEITVKLVGQLMLPRVKCVCKPLTFKSLLFNQMKKSTRILQMWQHFKLLEDNFKNHFQVTSKTILNSSETHCGRWTQWALGSVCRSGMSTAHEAAALDSGPAGGPHGLDKSLPHCPVLPMVFLPSAPAPQRSHPRKLHSLWAAWATAPSPPSPTQHRSIYWCSEGTSVF